ncbi:ACP S-malonyltransferase [Candidatus Saganbacteria bacterium]|nr:ACP S-malonyltransferase [Candidatus Saganbacteria bacterium]
MGKGFAEDYLAEANEILGLDLLKICFEGPEDELKRTELSQPAILAVSVAANDILKNRGLKPDYVAGHSLGEYSALVAAGSFSFKDALRLVHFRGKFMQEAVALGVGAMSAVLNLSKDKVIDCCKKASHLGVVELANFNSPDQIVISGNKISVKEAGRLCKEAGAKRVISLAVSAPFHCSLMKPAADKLKMKLDQADIKESLVPVIANINADVEKSAEEIRKNLYNQVTGSVLWVNSILKMRSLGVTTYIEVGPGKVLSDLIKKIDPEAEVKTYVEA